jgi:hypothetical protein
LADTEAAATEIESFLTREFRHHTAPAQVAEEGPLFALAQRTYAALSTWGADQGAPGEAFESCAREARGLLDVAAALWPSLGERLEAAERELWGRRSEVQTLRETLGRAEGSAQAAGAERDALRAEVDSLRATLSTVRGEAEALRSELDWARAQVSRSEEARQRAEDELSWAYQTRSWRVTAPLRLATALGRKWSR